MQSPPSLPPKPISDIWRPDLVRLAPLTPARRAFRVFVIAALRLLSWLFLKPAIQGLENYPSDGPALIVINHLGDADSALLAFALPGPPPEALGKIELQSLPVLGAICDGYGLIWLHRGQPDRRAMRAALEALAAGRKVVIAPEGRYSLNGGLEEGGSGAAYLALKADVPIVPIALTGTENGRVYPNMRRLRRTPVTLTVGVPFRVANGADRTGALREATRHTMTALAGLLPAEYRGVYGS